MENMADNKNETRRKSAAFFESHDTGQAISNHSHSSHSIVNRRLNPGGDGVFAGRVAPIPSAIPKFLHGT
jgi:hypothetical protein